ncbi:unnamed protein product, partial [Ceratitis capitata]
FSVTLKPQANNSIFLLALRSESKQHSRRLRIVRHLLWEYAFERKYCWETVS